MYISFIDIHSYILKYVAPRGQNTLRGALYPHPALSVTLTYPSVCLIQHLCLQDKKKITYVKGIQKAQNMKSITLVILSHFIS